MISLPMLISRRPAIRCAGISYAKPKIAAFLSRQLGIVVQPESVRFWAPESCACSPNRVSGPTSIWFLHFNPVADHVSPGNLSRGRMRQEFFLVNFLSSFCGFQFLPLLSKLAENSAQRS